MPRFKRACWLLLLLISCSPSFAAEAGNSSGAGIDHTFITVQAAANVDKPLTGRLLVFIKPGSGDTEIAPQWLDIESTWIAAKELQSLAPGNSVVVDADDIAFPKGFSRLPKGKYEMQAVLDVGHSYNYSQNSTKNWVSDVVSVDWQPAAKFPTLVLNHHPTEDPQRTAMRNALKAKATPDVAREEHFTSAFLSRFWGSTRELQAWVILPPGYSDKPAKHYPAVYWTHGFGGNLDYSLSTGLKIRERMESGQIPPMIWVLLDESIPQGTHEFADSVNNGPWGTALTREFIPYLEQHYQMDAKPTGRFLTGHSSGGWATLQLQINYPKVFGGTWSTAPDPSDFHDFTGVDLYAPHANLYHKADGTDYPLIRDKGKVFANIIQFAKMEDVIGPYGGQMTSFDWVFSPKGQDGAPLPMFNRQTGEVDPNVVAYWHDHYDLANIAKTNWASRGADLKGRIHLIVGTADTFYLDGSAHKLQAVLDELNADAHFAYIPGRTHSDLYTVGDDKFGLMNQIAKEMYAVARPEHP